MEKLRMNNKKKLTEREIKIIAYVADGWSGVEIADKLGITEPTIRMNLLKMFVKTNTCNRSHLVAYALRNGIIN